MTERTRETINLPYLTFPGMSQAVRTGNLVALAGQCSWGEDGEVVGVGDARAQAEQCFVNVERILREAGATLGDIVKLTCFIVGAEHFSGYAEVKSRYFPSEPPASTTVVVAGLLEPRHLLEVEAIAVIGG